MARSDAAREFVHALRLLELAGSHRSAPAVAIARSPVASSTASGGGCEAVHQVLRPGAGVGDAAEAADVVIQSCGVGADMDVAAGSRGDPGAILAKDRASPFQLRPGFGCVLQYRAHDLARHGGVALNHPLSRFSV